VIPLLSERLHCGTIDWLHNFRLARVIPLLSERLHCGSMLQTGVLGKLR